MLDIQFLSLQEIKKLKFCFFGTLIPMETCIVKGESNMAWTKKTAIGIGVAMGICATFAAMIPTPHKSEAAIAVFDEKNIEQAAETAIKTAKILTEEQKKYALMLLQLKKLDKRIFQEVALDQIKHAEARKTADIVYPQGAINYDKSVEQVWLDRLGDLNGILNGNITVYDEVLKEKERERMLDETYKNSVETAKQEILRTYHTPEEVQKVLDKSNNAEGNLQALQAGNILVSQGINEQSAQTVILAKILSMQSTTNARKIYQEAAERAKQEMTEKLNNEKANDIAAKQKEIESQKLSDSPYYDPSLP